MIIKPTLGKWGYRNLRTGRMLFGLCSSDGTGLEDALYQKIGLDYQKLSYRKDKWYELDIELHYAFTTSRDQRRKEFRKKSNFCEEYLPKLPSEIQDRFKSTFYPLKIWNFRSAYNAMKHFLDGQGITYIEVIDEEE